MKTDVAIGQRYGLLSVVGPQFRENGRSRVPCRCDCGTEKTIYRWHLVSGQTKSCGCLSRKRTAERNKTHGKTATPEYKIWRGIIDRCFYPSQSRYERYGGRGITMCERWRRSFESFLEDMGERPSAQHSIDRKDPEGNYEPSNCRWATKEQQARSRCKTKSWGSGVVGVTKVRNGNWAVRIHVNGKAVWVGTFKDLDTAIAHRMQAEEELWGR